MTTPELERAAQAVSNALATMIVDLHAPQFPVPIDCYLLATAAIRAALSEPNDELSEALDDRFGPRQGDGSDILRFILAHLCP